ncbi:MAG: thiamine pyrophosphate-dependent enzyme, partial [Anaerolineaceae bacterium]|nr:thiamine pyrophosphate-dependent enzyme [Anaerolineaceae bacterium]
SPIRLPGYRPNLHPVTEDIEKALELIHGARKPVILAGNGVLMSGAMWELREFAEKTQTPIAVTLLGIGSFPAAHPLHLGMMGMHGEAWVNHAIQESDLLLAFGMRFDDRVTGNTSNYAPNARKIHADIDPSEIDKNIRVDLALIGDLKETLGDMLPHLEARDHSVWLEEIAEIRRGSEPRDIQNQLTNGELRAAHVIHDIWRHTSEDTIIVTDVGQHQMWTAQYCQREKPYTLITSGGLGTMGFGLPAAIGAAFARPGEEVWAIVGDGGIQMTQAELATARQENIKVNVAIINNGYLGMVRQWQELFYEKRYSGTPLSSPDFVKIADAHGLTGIRVTQRSQVEAAIRQAQETEGTVVIDFRVLSQDIVYPMVPAGADLHQMLRRPLSEGASQE